jgi:hypothetical protein
MDPHFPNPAWPLNHRGFRRLALAPALCALLALACCAPLDSMQTQPLPSPTPQPAQAEVILCDSTQANCTSQDSFSLQVVRDMDVMVNWQNLTVGTHTQRVSFVLPSGDFYNSFVQSFEVAQGSNGTLTTIQALPVAGTFISQRRLGGVWSLTLELDGQAMNTRTFQLTP